uniref:Sugar phosphate transporter domain-containing protein n=1 Tax=Chromera velia CCMP2878 TaxID=1169474 RepID=A0A0G4GTN5_9ALVE|eukprot:Cvel_23328.t1-p1 / transcript=Cvel_23328.t1 / gene=Cvel_23328 / organism=Chromera_velia_CCMP2878 / gene_product=UDP-galactose transporter 1, putative / transcript_product=UDP-galactose transporter 1, putative / location=Cvel_scaffold2390:13244-17917(+) / protein_length=377 / sequence_SO=supercontig / SO=protein_coding / is_pseudo=false
MAPADATAKKSSGASGTTVLAIWFFLNLLITLYSKAVFSIHKFPYPLLMTAVHIVCTSIGVEVFAMAGMFEPAQLDLNGWVQIVKFSFVFTLNVWLSNASLMAVSVALHQVVRSSTPVFTIVLTWMLFRKTYPFSVLPPVLCVCLGVALTVRSTPTWTVFGLAITLAGTCMAVLKGIATQQLQVGSMKLSSIQLLQCLCPLAIVELLALSAAFGELGAVIVDENLTWTTGMHLLGIGCVACALNLVSFKVSGLVSVLTLNIAGNVKQVATCVLSVFIFGGSLGFQLLCGIILASVGAFWYGIESRKLKATVGGADKPTPGGGNRSEGGPSGPGIEMVATGRKGDGSEVEEGKLEAVAHVLDKKPFVGGLPGSGGRAN